MQYLIKTIFLIFRLDGFMPVVALLQTETSQRETTFGVNQFMPPSSKQCSFR